MALPHWLFASLLSASTRSRLARQRQYRERGQMNSMPGRNPGHDYMHRVRVEGTIIGGASRSISGSGGLGSADFGPGVLRVQRDDFGVLVAADVVG